MSMTPREIIKRNLTLGGPERIGMNFDGDRMNDFCGAGIGPSETWKQRRWVEGNAEYYDDEWGNVWFRIQGMSQVGEIHDAAIKDWADLKEYQLPDMANPKRFEEARKIFSEETQRYRFGGLPGFTFAVCRYLRKMEIYFQDLLLERDHIDELHDRVASLLEAIIRQLADAGADGIFFCEDWGTQQRLLVSPAMWRDIFKPLFKRLCGTAHQCGLDVIMHSCGYIWEIIDDLAEVGVNALQFDQPGLYGLARLADKLQTLNVCLYSPVDIQRIMPTGDRQRIEAEAEKMLTLFAGDRGGLIAKNYPDLHGIGVKPEWDQWAYDVFKASCLKSP